MDRDCTRSQNGRYVLRSREHDGVCIYLNEDKTCGVYEAKPDQCSAFPWWNENLENKKSWENTKNICPGIDHPEALIISKKTIKYWVELDRISEKGVRESEIDF